MDAHTVRAVGDAGGTGRRLKSTGWRLGGVPTKEGHSASCLAREERRRVEDHRERYERCRLRGRGVCERVVFGKVGETCVR